MPGSRRISSVNRFTPKHDASFELWDELPSAQGYLSAHVQGRIFFGICNRNPLGFGLVPSCFLQGPSTQYSSIRPQYLYYSYYIIAKVPTTKLSGTCSRGT